jgi:hypothetical protein
MLKKSIVYASVFFMIFSLAIANEPKKDNTISFTGSFDELKALKAIFGELTPLTDGGYGEHAIWRNMHAPESISSYFRKTENGEVRIVYQSSYYEDGIEKHTIITSTIPSDEYFKTYGFNCHACAPLISGAVFKPTTNGWVVESKNEYICVLGSRGAVSGKNFQLIEIGPNRYGVLYLGWNRHQGDITESVTLIMPYNGSMVKSLDLDIDGPHDGACDDKVLVDLKAIKGQYTSNGYYSLEADIEFNDGACGQVKNIKEKRYFEFNNGKFERKK